VRRVAVKAILAEWVIVVALSVAGCSLLALAGGRQRNADLLNYHFYNGYALLEGRLDRDIAPAGPYTYLNPVLDVAHYLGYRHVRPVVWVAVLGALQGLNLVLVWAIACRALGRRPVWLPALATLLAGTGQNAVSLLGTPFGDNTLSILALAAVLFVVESEEPGRVRLLLAGVAGGGAVGLKLTLAAPHVGLAALAAWVAWRRRRPALLLAFALGSVLGWGLTNGWWALEMWRRFANPLFPFLNDVFRSPYANAHWLADPRWPPRELLDWLRPPLDAALGVPHRLQEVPVQDPRFLLVFLALIPWSVASCRRARSGADPSRSTIGDLAVYWLAAYVAWVGVFHYYRYATALEMLAPVLVLGALVEIWPRRKVAVALVLASVVLLATHVSRWAPDRGWRPRWFEPRLPRAALERGQLIVLLDPTTSFAAPFFPEDATFVGLAFTDGHGPALEKAIAERLARHVGPLRALQRDPGDEEDLLKHGLRIVPGTCTPVLLGPTGGGLGLCELERLPLSPGLDTGEGATPRSPGP
jgi:hypothetical protein